MDPFHVVQTLSLGSTVASMLLRDIFLPSRWQPADLWKLGLCHGHPVVTKVTSHMASWTQLDTAGNMPKRAKRLKLCFKLRGKMNGFTAMPC